MKVAHTDAILAIGITVCATVLVGALQARLPSQGQYILLLAPVVLLTVIALINYPEISFALFLNAGAFKADPRLDLPGLLDWTVIFFALAAGGALLRILDREKELGRLPTGMILPLLFIAASALLSLSYTLSPVYGQDKLLRFLSLTSFALVAPWLILRSSRAIERFLVVHLVVSGIVAFDMFVNSSSYYDLSVFGTDNYLRAGTMSAQAIIILTLYLMHFPSKAVFRRIAVLGLIGLLLAAVGFSAARSAFVLLALTLLGILITTYRRGGRWRSFVGLELLAGRSAVVLLAIVLAIPLFFVLFRDDFSAMAGRLSLLPESGMLGRPRQYLFAQALAAILDFPAILIGVGIGGFDGFIGGASNAIRGVYPHNIVLEIGAELGLPSLVAFVLLCRNAAKNLSVLYRQRIGELLITDVLMFLLVFTFGDHLLHGGLNDARFLFALLGITFSYCAQCMSHRGDR